MSLSKWARKTPGRHVVTQSIGAMSSKSVVRPSSLNQRPRASRISGSVCCHVFDRVFSLLHGFFPFLAFKLARHLCWSRPLLCPLANFFFHPLSCSAFVFS